MSDFTTNLINFDLEPFGAVQGFSTFDSVVTSLVADPNVDVNYTAGQQQSFYRMNLPLILMQMLIIIFGMMFI